MWESKQNGRVMETSQMILITGGAGFIGAQLAGRLIRTDPDIRIRVVDTLHRDALAFNHGPKIQELKSFREISEIKR